MKAIKTIFFYVAVLIFFIVILSIGFDRQEQAECLKWQDWTKDYPKFYLLDWQKEQCTRHGIEVNAPVHSTKQEQKPAAISAPAREFREVEAIVYAYNSLPEQTDGRPYEMASGKTVYDGAIACPISIAFGTKVEAFGREYTCEDRMGPAHRDKNHFDIWMESRDEAIAWGARQTTVKIYK